MELDSAIAVNGQGMAVNPDGLSSDHDVSLDQRQMNVQRFWIAGQRLFEIGRGQCRQWCPQSRLARS